MGVILKQYVATQKPHSVGQIKAIGDIKIRIGILWFVGVVSVGLLGIGTIPLLKDPSSAKDVWVIIGPILTGITTGTVAYFTGEKQGSQK